MAHGRIDAATVEWTPLKDDIRFRSEANYSRFEKVRLEDAVAPAGRVVVGVALCRWPNTNYHVSVKILTAEFNSTDATIRGPFTWHLPTEVNARSQLSVADADVSTASVLPSRRTATEPSNVQFGASSILKDLGQTVVPLVDTQAVDSMTPAPLRAIGFYHKGESGFGVFVGLQMSTIDVFEMM